MIRRNFAQIGGASAAEYWNLQNQQQTKIDIMNEPKTFELRSQSGITKITIARLYSLGNYEHVRYELTAEVPSNNQAPRVFTGMENILNALRPYTGSKFTAENIERMKAQYADVEKLDDETVKLRYYIAPSDRAKWMAEKKAEIADVEDRFATINNRHTTAIQLLANLGGAADFKDAKNAWENESY